MHERTGRTRRDGVAVQASERDELEDEAANIVRRGCRGTAKGRKRIPFLAQLPDKVLQVLVCRPHISPITAHSSR
jgi:hypothetical protein